MAGYGHPYVIHAANLVSRRCPCFQTASALGGLIEKQQSLERSRVMVPPFQAAAQQQQQQQEPVRVAHEQVILFGHLASRQESCQVGKLNALVVMDEILLDHIEN